MHKRNFVFQIIKVEKKIREIDIFTLFYKITIIKSYEKSFLKIYPPPHPLKKKKIVQY